jgi:hypothetical protein
VRGVRAWLWFLEGHAPSPGSGMFDIFWIHDFFIFIIIVLIFFLEKQHAW